LAIVVLDKKGRILIPKEIRDSIGADAGSVFIIRLESGKVVLEKVGRPSEVFAGIFKPKETIPENLDKFAEKVIREWWKKKEST